MHPIHLRAGGSEAAMSARQLRKYVFTVCNKHRVEKRALMFAFLLFNRRNAQVARVLDDSHFYDELDQIAGSSLTVFFIHSELTGRDRRSDSWSNDANEVARVITDQFEVSGYWNREKPAILFFQVDGNQISQARFASFADDRWDKTFAAMARLLKTAAESIAQVESSLSANTNEIFNLVDNAVRNDAFLKSLRIIWRVVQVIAVVKGLLFWAS